MSKSPAAEIVDNWSVFEEEMDAAMAIMDCAEVLTALERAEVTAHSDGQTGGGYAMGMVMRDVSLPHLLNHGYSLLQSARNQVDLMRETALTALKKHEA